MHPVGRFGLGLAVAALAACAEPTGPGPRGDLSGEWETATPASQGLDQDRLDRALDQARALPRLLSLLVVRNDKLVLETYLNGNRADSLNDVRSVTKSLVSTLVGIAVGRGDLPGAGATIGGYLDPTFTSELDPGERAITIRDLLTMSSGYQWDESTVSGYNAWVTSTDPIRYLLRRPLTAVPGTRFTYNSAAVNLLGLVLERATGISLPEYARDHLFEPLGVPRARWEMFPDGHVNAGAGIDLRPRDLAKIGALWLRRGVVGGTQVVPADWIDAGTTPQFPYWEGGDPLGQQSYGYLWWLDRAGGRDDFFAWGFGGQFIWVAPDLDLIVVVTTDWRNSPVPADQLAWNGLDLIVNYVLPAAH